MRTLWPHQREALLAAKECGGLFGDLPVASGKTLLTALLPTVLESRRTLLLLPASLINETYHRFDAIYDVWERPSGVVKFLSYTRLAMAKHAGWLDAYKPDLIIADEADAMKNSLAAVTKRVLRYIASRPDTRVCVLSATMIGQSWESVGRLCYMAFRADSPLPLSLSTLRHWDRCLSRDGEELWKLNKEFKAEHGNTRKDIQRSLAHTVRQHAGVISLSSGVERSPVSLSLRDAPLPSELCREALRRVRDTNIAPGTAGIECLPSDLSRHEQTLAWGFFLTFSPEPPVEWIDARRLWARFVAAERRKHNELDTEAQIEAACADGRLDSEEIYEDWQRVRVLYREGHKAVWIDTEVIDALPAPTERTIYWTRFTELGRKVAERLDIPYFNGGPLPADGGACVLSIAAYGRGHELQFNWSENHILTPPSEPVIFEQLLGRTVRPGQSERVSAIVWLTSARARRRFQTLMSEARLFDEDNLLTKAHKIA